MQNIEHKTYPDSIHIAVVVILKGDKVLISKREKKAHQGGLWEFPGGKLEVDEDIIQAAAREIQEELGIRILESRPLIKTSHQYSDRNVLLETRLCTLFSGKDYLQDDNKNADQFGLEGQLVKWVDIERLDDYQFPAPNRAIINALRLTDRYLISPDFQGLESEQFIRQFAENCQHYSLIQLRVKSLKAKPLNALLQSCAKLAENNKVSLMINSACIDLTDDNFHYDGIHLTSSHLFDNDFIDFIHTHLAHKMISASCHNYQDIEQANRLNLNFIVISPVQRTTSHPQQRPLGWENFASLAGLAKMPCFALGGMKTDDIYRAQQHGGQGISAINGLWR